MFVATRHLRRLRSSEGAAQVESQVDRHIHALGPNRTGAFFVRGWQDLAAAGSPWRKEVMPSSQYVVFVRPVTVATVTVHPASGEGASDALVSR